MKRSDNDSNHLDHVPRWIGIAGAIFLVILLKACASSAVSEDFGARDQIQTHGTGRRLQPVAQIIPHSPFSLCAKSSNTPQLPAGQQTAFSSGPHLSNGDSHINPVVAEGWQVRLGPRPPWVQRSGDSQP